MDELVTPATPTQRAYVEMLSAYHPGLYATWAEPLRRALDAPQLDARSREIILTGICAVVHYAPGVIEGHVERAFDAGSNVGELFEIALRVGAQEGNHAQSSAGEALWNVIQRRQAAGRPVPAAGEPLGPQDLIPHSPWTPVLFPYHTPWPRNWRVLAESFAPDRAALESEYDRAVARLPRQLSRRLHEALDVVIDSVVRWKQPRIDHHTHEALNCGSNVQELVEMILVAAEEVQGARDSHVSGRPVETGTEIVRYGLECLDRVIQERAAAGRYTPLSYGDPVPDLAAEAAQRTAAH
jgi:alkylhydroperoxidase/carboxymuconolactone decarboxylase family protein YurZ